MDRVTSINYPLVIALILHLKFALLFHSYIIQSLPLPLCSTSIRISSFTAFPLELEYGNHGLLIVGKRERIALESIFDTTKTIAAVKASHLERYVVLETPTGPSRKILVLFTEISHGEWVRGDIELLQICMPRSDTLVQREGKVSRKFDTCLHIST